MNMQKSLVRIFLLLVVSILLYPVVPCRAEGGADSILFKRGVASFQRNRFSEAITTFTSLLKSNPRTPLKDMTLYYLARAHLKSGHHEQAATLTAGLMKEFPASYNLNTIDSELLNALQAQTAKKAAAEKPKAGSPPPSVNGTPTGQAGVQATRQAAPVSKVTAKAKTAVTKTPPPVRQPQTQRNVRQQNVSASRTAAVHAPAPPGRKTAKPGIPPHPSRKEIPAARRPAVVVSASGGERTMAVERYASVVGKGIRPIQLEVSSDWVKATAGSTVSIPFTVSNHDSASHTLQLSCEFPPFFLPRFKAGNQLQRVEEVSMKPGATYHGALTLTVPGDTADGARFSYRIFAHSVSDSNFSASGDAGIIASAHGEQD